MTNEEANQRLVDILNRLVQNNPELRFGQILQQYGFIENKEVCVKSDNSREYMEQIWVDEFYTSPKTVLERVTVEIRRQASNSKG